MRTIDTATLDIAARDYARMFLSPDRKKGNNWVNGPSRVMHDLFAAAYKDEHAYLRDAVREELGKRPRDRFDALASKTFTPRDDKVFETELAARLALTLGGDHREGAIGRVKVGRRFMGMRMVEVVALDSIRRRKRLGLPKSARETVHREVPYYWPVYAGEMEERSLPGGGVADEFPDDYRGLPLSASVTGIGNTAAKAAADAVVDLLDEGSDNAIAVGYTVGTPGAMLAFVDIAITDQVDLFLLGFDATAAYGAAADGDPGGVATAAAITDDSDAADTGTVAFVRSSSSNDGAAALNDHIDGNAGTSDEAWLFNTAAIVAGAVVSASSATLTVPEAA